MPPNGIGAGRPTGAAARRRRQPISPKIGTSTRTVSRSRQAGLVPSRSGERHGAITQAGPVAREHAGLGQAERDRAGHDQRAATVIAAPLADQHRRIERMMQHKLAAAEEPRQQRQADAGERGRRQRRQHGRVLRQPAFQQHAEAAGQQLQMTARHRHDAVFADVEGDGGKVRGRHCSARSRSSAGTGSSFSAVNRSSNGTTPSGRSAPKPQT